MSASLTDLKAHKFDRYAPGDADVSFDIAYCGICHTDVHFIQNMLGFCQYPLVPGHELIGKVTAVGSKVTKFKVGDLIGVGCMVDSCKSCSACKKDEEQYCATGSVFTYGGVTKYGRAGPDGVPTAGGYSDKMVVHQDFGIKVPDGTPLDKAAPLLCAGITMYDPLKYHGVKEGTCVAIVGCGGLGQMGIKLAKAMGATVTAISTSPQKEADAKAMGASNFLLSTDAEAMGKAAKSFDLILDTVSADHEIMPYIGTLKTDGKHVLIGLTGKPMSIAGAPFLFGRVSVTGSLIGGIKATQEMMDFCTKNNIYPNVQVIKASEVQGALEKLDKKSDQIVRYVIDCSTLKDL
eukprot:Tamp_20177.p1 GENE.Tamp_20177~~Tamp_20177.p1  ORF type:complete len:361 (+),score=102.73 Tamp_20177:39-1085(+)